MTESNVQFTRSELAKKFFPIYFYRKHLDIAARDILGLNLAPHHRKIIRDWGRQPHYCFLLCGRGMGKSVCIAIYYVLMAVLYPRNKLLVIGGAGFRQSKFVMFEMEKIILNRLSGQKDFGYARISLQDPRKVISKDPAFWSIQFGNGSIIYAVPLGDGSTIRGLRSYALAQDEAFLLPNNFVQQILEPFLNVMADPTKCEADQKIKNQSIKTSTIDYAFRDFYKEYSQFRAVIESGKASTLGAHAVQPHEISLFEWNFEDSFYITDEGKEKSVWGMDRRRLLQKRDAKNTDIDVWMAENKNIPMDISGGYFSFDHIDACSNVILRVENDTFTEALDQCAAQCILGIDTAPSGANSAFVVTKVGSLNYTDRDNEICKIAAMGEPCPILFKGNCLYKKYNSVVFAYERNRMSQRDRVKMIYEILDNYNIIGIAMDARGGGYELADLLQDKEYIINVAGEGNIPLYDPERTPDGIGLPILKLYATTQDDNLIYNSYLKALLANTQLLLPKPLRGRPDNPRLLETYGHLETLVNQLVRIKALPAGKSVKFEIEAVDPNSGRQTSGKKDLYSALLYSVARLRELVQDQESQNRVVNDELAAPVAFYM